jgi:hypothetical protein
MSPIIHLADKTRILRQRHAGDIQFAKKFIDVHLPDQTPMLFFDAHAKAPGTGRAAPYWHFGVWSGNATSRNFLFAKMSPIIHLEDKTRILRQRHASDIQFAKKFIDVHLPDQTPMLFFVLPRLRTADLSYFNG